MFLFALICCLTRVFSWFSLRCYTSIILVLYFYLLCLPTGNHFGQLCCFKHAIKWSWVGLDVQAEFISQCFVVLLELFSLLWLTEIWFIVNPLLLLLSPQKLFVILLSGLLLIFIAHFIASGWSVLSHNMFDHLERPDWNRAILCHINAIDWMQIPRGSPLSIDYIVSALMLDLFLPFSYCSASL